MTTDTARVQYLFKKHLDSSASPSEVRELFDLIGQEKIDEEILSSLDLELAETDPLSPYDQKRWNLIFEKIKDDTAAIEADVIPEKKSSSIFLRACVAAAIVVMILGAGLFYFSKMDKDQIAQSAYANDVPPGKRGATLTLANGNKIRLSDVANGELARQANVEISKTADGQVVYKMIGLNSAPNVINTLSTERGETYILTLPDKTQVWLNAASSLTYSATLNEHGVRSVKLEGEAYFQVAKDKSHPFTVESKGQLVEVLGTHFNINSYEEEKSVKTTLLEGSVKVRAGLKQQILKAGEQSILANNKLISRVANIEETIAWKNGDFIFERENIESIMRKLQRWYNIEVDFQGEIPKQIFYARISRSQNISAVLNALEEAEGVHFKVEGRRVTVTK